MTGRIRPTVRLTLLALILAWGCGPSAQAIQQSQPAFREFRAVAVTAGGEVTIRRGERQSVTIVEGAPRISVENGRLVIDNHGRPHRPRPRIEVVTPWLDAASVANGGRLVIAGGFGRQPELATSVAHGGLLDSRQLAAGRLTATVSHGGAILARADERLDATITQGGLVTYWGNPRVSSTIRRGGQVAPGRPADLEGPASELGPRVPQLPHVPPLTVPGG